MEHYYLDTNILVKYSCYQDYKTKPEDNVETVRELINSKKGVFYISHLTLWEFYSVLLKFYRKTDDTTFGNTAAERQNKFMRIVAEIPDNITTGKLCMDNSSITPDIFIKTQKLMFEYGLNQKRSVDSIDALHITLVQFLAKKYGKNITVITADKTMTEICQLENVKALFIQPPQLETNRRNS